MDSEKEVRARSPERFGREGRTGCEAVGPPRLEEARARLGAYCRAIAHSPHDAEDLAQESVIRAWPVLSGAVSHPNPVAYAKRVARRIWIDTVRRRRSEEAALFREQAGKSLRHEEEPLRSALAREAMEALLEGLTAGQRTVLLLRDVFGYSAKETASALGWTEGAVKASLHRARRRAVEAGRSLREPGLKTQVRRNAGAGRGGPEAPEGAGTLPPGEDQLADADLLQAYAAAIHNEDAEAVLRLARSGGVDPVYAVARAMSLRPRGQAGRGPVLRIQAAAGGAAA